MKIGWALGELALASDGSSTLLSDLVAQARQAEQEGVDSVWLANINGLDALTAAAIVGHSTERIRVGTAVVPTFPRHPFAMAQQARTTQLATGNRFTLGIGLSHRVVVETMLGLSWQKPYSHMKEYLAVLGPLLSEGRVRHRGEEYRVANHVSVRGATPPPVLIAALAPKMLALAGSVADGTVTWMVGPQTLREYLAPGIREAAAQAGRAAPEIVVALPICVCDDPQAAREEAGRRYAVYNTLPSYRAMRDREAAAGPQGVAIVGDEDAVLEQLQQLAEAGATTFAAGAFPVGEDADGSIARTRALLKRYLDGAAG